MIAENSFYTVDELKKIGFKTLGRDVLLSRKTSIYGAGSISIGNNVRIDDFCILSGNIILGNNIHIAAYCALYGSAGIELMDFSGMSSKCVIYSATDDYSGDVLIGACVPIEMRNIIQGKVILERFVQLGSGTTVLPGVTIKEGSVTGCISLVLKSVDEWGIYTGVPVKRLKERSKNLLIFLEQ